MSYYNFVLYVQSIGWISKNVYEYRETWIKDGRSITVAMKDPVSLTIKKLFTESK